MLDSSLSGRKLTLLLFFCLLSSGVYAGDNSKECNFSLKEEIPKNIKFTVQSGRVAFLCKNDNFFLRGTVTRTLPWQLTSRIFETMADRLKAETLEKWPSGRLYRIRSDKQENNKTLVCGYHSRDQYSMELCAPDDDKNAAADLVRGVIREFRKISPEASPLLKSAALYSQKRVFTEENETREPALLALTMPPGYVEVTRRENRALFTDAAGLAEMEIFYEISELALDSELAHKVYRKSISGFLSKQGPWRIEKEEAAEKKGNAICLSFTDNDTRLSHYCYTVIAQETGAKKRYLRIAFVGAFLREAVDRAKLMAEQQTLLNQWADTIRKHSK